MPLPTWVVAAEKGTGRKWEDIDPFTRLQFQLATKRGRELYYTPIRVLAYGLERLDQSRSSWNKDKPYVRNEE